ncbi:hypothetical protein PHISCL_10491 [Aspergillus sclerotialis]|uniref:Uncharacterized protein n=1 Tax=Aspergillus sclerotialis TaxID=2070753 RepID=A0A3A2Z268_9EURO|nr:hypothetical protein PHISCL_10491 [Aspergillus sclerotialis]
MSDGDPLDLVLDLVFDLDLRLEGTRRGKSRVRSGYRAGNEAQIMATLVSIEDQRVAGPFVPGFWFG